MDKEPLPLRWRTIFHCEKCGGTWKYSSHSNMPNDMTEDVSVLAKLHKQHRENCKGN